MWDFLYSLNQVYEVVTWKALYGKFIKIDFLHEDLKSSYVLQ